MSTYQLAGRIGVSQPTLSNWERREATGAISLGSLRRVASAMECEFVYALVPRKPLRAIVEQRATQVAQQMVEQVSHSMELEGQGTSAARHRMLVRERAQSLRDGPARRLWDG